jgi:hypothetical protein
MQKPLYTSSISFPSSPLAAAIPVTGRHLQAMLKCASPQQRAEIVARLVNGQLQVIWPMPAQAARMGRVHPRLVHRALGHAPKRRRPTDADIMLGIARVGLDRLSTVVEDFVERYPHELTNAVIDRLLAMIDRATAPIGYVAAAK